MLENTVPRTHEKPICLRLLDPALVSLLQALLREWRFTVLPEADDETLLLAEEGAVEPERFQRVVWLSRSPYASQGRLQLPVAIEEFYAVLERRYHKPPRRHMRLALNLPARVELAGTFQATSITSISDQGCRLQYPSEVARGETVQIEFSIAGHPLLYSARVIYCVGRSRPEDGGRFDVGLLFENQSISERRSLLDFIIFAYLQRVQEKLPKADFQTGMQAFDLPGSIRKQIGLSPLS